MKDIILINPPPVVFKNLSGESAMYANPPLGLGYLASALIKKGYSVVICDMGPEKLLIADILSKIETYGAKIIGISSFVANHGNGIRLAKLIKQRFPYITIIMGGPQASFIPEEVLSHGCIDIVAMFEGEITIPEIVGALLDGSSIENIAGIAYKHEGVVIINPIRPLIENIDEIEFPAWDLFKLKNYFEPGVIITGRGCQYKCIFCSAGSIPGAKYRMRSAQNVVDEIEYLYEKHGMTQFFIADYTFTASKKHCIDICREIRKRKLEICWEAEARANTINDDIVSEMAAAGCRQIQIGAESGDDGILRSIEKNVTTDTIESAVKTVLKHGISVVCSFILGHPCDTLDTIDKTIEFAVRLKSLNPGFCTCKFAILTPLPGTPIYEQKDKYGIRLLTKNWDKYTFTDPVIETENLSKKELQNAYAKAWISYGKCKLISGI